MINQIQTNKIINSIIFFLKVVILFKTISKFDSIIKMYNRSK